MPLLQLVVSQCDRRDEMVQDGKPEWTGKVGEATSESYVTAQQAYEVSSTCTPHGMREQSQQSAHDHRLK